MDPFRVFILAGGLGTRLRAVSGERPKLLMPIAGEPFLRRLLARLAAQNLRECVLCLGYRAQEVVDYFTAQPIPNVQLHYSVEPEPRGTAGALQVAHAFWNEQNLILNGDTELSFDFVRLYDYHRTYHAAVTIGLAHVADASRYGRAQMGEDNRLIAFLEKEGLRRGGLVNAGVYLATRRALDEIPTNRVSSIEHDWLPDLLRRDFAVYGLKVAEHFTDIGTPEEYERLNYS